MEEELDLRDIFAVIRKRWRMILIIPTVSVLISALVTFFYLTPMYKSSTALMVIHSPTETGYDIRQADITFSRQLVKSYGEIVKSRRVAQRAVSLADEDKKISYSALLGKIDVGLVRDTEFINITVTDKDPEMAAYWANLVTEAFKSEIFNIMRVENVNVLDEAIPLYKPVSPNAPLNLAMAGVLGIMVAIGLSMLLEFLDNTIKLPKDVNDSLQLPVLGAIPDFSKSLK